LGGRKGSLADLLTCTAQERVNELIRARKVNRGFGSREKKKGGISSSFDEKREPGQDVDDKRL